MYVCTCISQSCRARAFKNCSTSSRPNALGLQFCTHVQDTVIITNLCFEALLLCSRRLNPGYNWRYYHTFAAEDMNGRVIRASSAPVPLRSMCQFQYWCLQYVHCTCVCVCVCLCLCVCVSCLSYAPGIAHRVHARSLERSTLLRYYMWRLGIKTMLL